MGDYYFIQNLKCAYCGKENEEVYYAESSGVTTFKCEHCKKRNRIAMIFKAVKLKGRAKLK